MLFQKSYLLQWLVFKHFSLTVFRYSPQTRRDWEETNSGERTVFLHQSSHKSRISNFDAELVKIHFTGYLFDTTAKRSEVSPHKIPFFFFFFYKESGQTHTPFSSLASIITFKFSWKTDDIRHTHLNLFNQILTVIWSVCFNATSVSNSSLFFR